MPNKLKERKNMTQRQNTQKQATEEQVESKS